MRLSDEVIDGDVRSETLRSIGEALEAHIQLEEREVFPMIEMTLPGERGGPERGGLPHRGQRSRTVC
jgi:hypothetical protein